MTISSDRFLCLAWSASRHDARSLGMAARPATTNSTGPDVTTRNLDAIATTPQMAHQDAPPPAPPPSGSALQSPLLTPGADWPWLQAAVHMASGVCGRAPAVPRDEEWSVAPRVATRTPVPATRSIATARAFTMRTLQKWGAEARGDDAAAVVTELMTNALQHALAELPGSRAISAWPIRLGLADPGPYVICAVADPSTQLPAPRRPYWQDEAGRGLLVVGSLSDQWGCCTAPDGQGKVVWAAFAALSRTL